MSLGEIPPVLTVPSNVPTEETKDELVSYTPTKRLYNVYERIIRDLQSDRDRMVIETANSHEQFHCEISGLKSEVATLSTYKIAHARLHTARAENAVSSLFSILLSSGGAALMGIFPRTDIEVPWQFICGAACVLIAVVLVVCSRICALLIRKFFPSLIDDGLDKAP